MGGVQDRGVWVTSGVTPSFVLRNHPGGDSGTLKDAKDQAQVFPVQDKYPTCCMLSTPL